MGVELPPARGGFAWAVWLTVTPEKLVSRNATVGPSDHNSANDVRGTDATPVQGWLYALPEVTGLRDAMGARLTISQPNQVADLELLDIPCRVPVLLPASVKLVGPSSFPEGVDEIKVFVAVSAGSFQSPVQARRLVTVPATGTMVAIPSWARKVAPLYGALVTSIQLFDGQGTLIGTAVQGQQSIELPPSAVFLGQSGATPFAATFEY